MARQSGAGLTRRGSIRLSFDAFQCKSRPGLSVSETEALLAEQEHLGMRSINARQSGALSLVQICKDPLLSLVDGTLLYQCKSLCHKDTAQGK